MTVITTRHWETGELSHIEVVTPAEALHNQAASGVHIVASLPNGYGFVEIPNDHIVCIDGPVTWTNQMLDEYVDGVGSWGRFDPELEPAVHSELKRRGLPYDEEKAL